MAINFSKVMGFIFVAIVLGVAGYVASLDELPIPGRLVAGIDYLQRPWTYFISGSIAVFGLTVAFLVVDDKRYRNIATILFFMSFVLFWIGTMAGSD